MFARRARRLAFRLTCDDAYRYEALIGKIFGVHNWTSLIERALETFWQSHGSPMPSRPHTPPKLLDGLDGRPADRQHKFNFDYIDQLVRDGVDVSDTVARPSSGAAAAIAAKPTTSRPARARAASSSKSSTSTRTATATSSPKRGSKRTRGKR